MTLNKKKMVREIGRRTRLTNREVQEVIEALVDVWTEELVAGGRIELQNFFVLEVRNVDRGHPTILVQSNKQKHVFPRYFKRVSLRVSKALKAKLQG